MTLYVNTRILKGPLTGVQRYLSTMLSQLRIEVVPIGDNIPSGSVGHVWEQTRLPGTVRDGLLWSPANTGPLAVQRQVVTVHDVAVLEHPEWFAWRFSWWYRYLIPRLTRRVESVITVSEYSKERLIERCGIDAERVHVTHLGIDHTRFSPKSQDVISETKLRLNLPDVYFLIVGSMEPRKNLGRVFAAWEQIYSKLSDAKLVVVGGTGKVFSGVGYRNVPRGIRFLGRVDDTDLPAIYSGAFGFIYASLYEGFGLPPLEAMACGTPTIVSNTTSLPEVVGDAALKVNPLNIDDISSAILQIYKSSSLREKLTLLGKSRAQSFSWDTVNSRTIEVLRHYL